MSTAEGNAGKLKPVYVCGPPYILDGRALDPESNTTYYHHKDLKSIIDDFYSRTSKGDGSEVMPSYDEHDTEHENIGRVVHLWVDGNNKLYSVIRVNPLMSGGKKFKDIIEKDPSSVGLSTDYGSLLDPETGEVSNKVLRGISLVENPDLKNCRVEKAGSSVDEILDAYFPDGSLPENSEGSLYINTVFSDRLSKLQKTQENVSHNDEKPKKGERGGDASGEHENKEEMVDDQDTKKKQDDQANVGNQSAKEDESPDPETDATHGYNRGETQSTETDPTKEKTNSSLEQEQKEPNKTTPNTPIHTTRDESPAPVKSGTSYASGTQTPDKYSQMDIDAQSQADTKEVLPRAKQEQDTPKTQTPSMTDIFNEVMATMQTPLTSIQSSIPLAARSSSGLGTHTSMQSQHNGDGGARGDTQTDQSGQTGNDQSQQGNQQQGQQSNQRQIPDQGQQTNQGQQLQVSNQGQQEQQNTLNNASHKRSRDMYDLGFDDIEQAYQDTSKRLQELQNLRQLSQNPKDSQEYLRNQALDEGKQLDENLNLLKGALEELLQSNNYQPQAIENAKNSIDNDASARENAVKMLEAASSKGFQSQRLLEWRLQSGRLGQPQAKRPRLDLVPNNNNATPQQSNSSNLPLQTQQNNNMVPWNVPQQQQQWPSNTPVPQQSQLNQNPLMPNQQQSQMLNQFVPQQQQFVQQHQHLPQQQQQFPQQQQNLPQQQFSQQQPFGQPNPQQQNWNQFSSPQQQQQQSMAIPSQQQQFNYLKQNQQSNHLLPMGAISSGSNLGTGSMFGQSGSNVNPLNGFGGANAFLDNLGSQNPLASGQRNQYSQYNQRSSRMGPPSNNSNPNGQNQAEDEETKSIRQWQAKPVGKVGLQNSSMFAQAFDGHKARSMAEEAQHRLSNILKKNHVIREIFQECNKSKPNQYEVRGSNYAIWGRTLPTSD